MYLGILHLTRSRLDEANGKVSRLENGARLAIRADDIETARQAIAVQIQVEQEAQKRRAELELSEKAYRSSSAVYKQLMTNLATLKEKKAAILKRYRQQQLTRQLQKQYKPFIVDPEKDILGAIARMESKIEQQEIELEVQTELTKTLGISFNEERVQRLERHAQVDQRLNEMKKQLGENH